MDWLEHPNHRIEPVVNQLEKQFLVVRCGPYRLAVPRDLVSGVVSSSEIVPMGLPDLEGLLWRDRALLPAVSLAPMMGLAEGAASGSPSHGIIVRSRYGPICLLVDEAVDFIELASGSVRPLPPVVLKASTLRGMESAAMAKEILMILDPVELLGDDRASSLIQTASVLGGISSTETE